MVFEKETTEDPYEPSALSKLVNAGVAGATSPGKLAQLVAETFPGVPPGAEEVVSQALQAAWNMGVSGSEEFMKATIRQHGRSAGAELQDLLIQQAIEDGAGVALSGQSFENQISLAEDLIKYLHGFQERLSLAAQSYQQKSLELYEAGMFEEFHIRFEQECVLQTCRLIAQVVEHVNECDIPFVERYIARLESIVIG